MLGLAIAYRLFSACVGKRIFHTNGMLLFFVYEIPLLVMCAFGLNWPSAHDDRVYA